MFGCYSVSNISLNSLSRQKEEALQEGDGKGCTPKWTTGISNGVYYCGGNFGECSICQQWSDTPPVEAKVGMVKGGEIVIDRSKVKAIGGARRALKEHPITVGLASGCFLLFIVLPIWNSYAPLGL
jgi:hypothetical protein